MTNWDGDNEGSAFSQCAFCVDSATVTIRDSATDGEADACTFKLVAAVEPLEDCEDFVEVFLVEANSVVLDR
jgi:hypothetical protein